MEQKIIETNRGLRLPVIFEKNYVEKTEGEEKRFIEGLAAAPGEDRNVPLYELTEECLREAVNDLKVNQVLFLEHDKHQPIGKIVDAKFIPGKGIWIKALISKTADKVWTMIQEGVLTGFSIGGSVKKFIEEAGKTISDTVCKVIRIELNEVSVVALPANIHTRIWNSYISKALSLNMEGGELLMGDKEFAEVEEEIKEEEKISKELANEKSDIKEIEKSTIEKTDEVNIKNDEKKSAETEKDEIDIVKDIGDETKVPADFVIEEAMKDKIDKAEIIRGLKAALKAKNIEKVKEAINKVISLLEGKYYEYYYKEEYDKNRKKEENEKYPKVDKALEDIRKEIEVLKTFQSDSIKNAVKEVLATLPDEIRKSVAVSHKDEEKKKDTRTFDERLSDAVRATIENKG